MNSKSYIQSLKYSLAIAMLWLNELAMAQPSPGDLNGPPNLPDSTSGDTPMGGSAPIDANLSIWLVFVLIYLLFKYQETFKQLFAKLKK